MSNFKAFHQSTNKMHYKGKFNLNRVTSIDGYPMRCG